MELSSCRLHERKQVALFQREGKTLFRRQMAKRGPELPWNGSAPCPLANSALFLLEPVGDRLRSAKFPNEGIDGFVLFHGSKFVNHFL